MSTVTEPTVESLSKICGILFNFAQKHLPKTDHRTAVNLLHIADILKDHGIDVKYSSHLAAQATAYAAPEIITKTAEYRNLRAKFVACLSTIADLGKKTVKQSKTPFHAGVNEGLRRAAKIAIMFLDDFNENGPEFMSSPNGITPNYSPEKPRSSFIR